MCVCVCVCVQGDYTAARTFYQRALLLSPGSRLLKENLAKLDRLERRLTEGPWTGLAHLDLLPAVLRASCPSNESK